MICPTAVFKTLMPLAINIT